MIDFLTGALPNLFTEADATALAPKLEPAAVREHLTDMRRKLAGPEGMVLKDVVAADPVGMSALVVAKVLPLQTGFGDAQIVDGRITSGDGRHVLLMAEPKFAVGEFPREPCAGAGPDAARRATWSRNFPACTSPSRAAIACRWTTRRIIKADADALHHPRHGGDVGPVSDGVSAALAGDGDLFAVVLRHADRGRGAGALLADHLSAIATGFATIAIGITVDYAIYVIYHLDNASQGGPRCPWGGISAGWCCRSASARSRPSPRFW